MGFEILNLLSHKLVNFKKYPTNEKSIKYEI